MTYRYYRLRDRFNSMTVQTSTKRTAKILVSSSLACIFISRREAALMLRYARKVGKVKKDQS